MSGRVTGLPFAVAVRVKRRDRDASIPSPAETVLQLPKLPPSEIAAAAGLAAVRRALEQMPIEEFPST